MIKCTKYCYPEMPLTRRAHKLEETGATQDAPEDKAQGPCISLPEEAEPKNLHLGVG